MLADRIVGLDTRDQFLGLASDALVSEARADPGPGGASRHLLLMTLDNLRQANDTTSLATGDEILHRVAKRFAIAAGQGAILGRLNGDEFAALLPEGVDGAAIAGQVMELTGRPYAVHGQVVALGASIGRACWPADGATVETLLQAASIALDKARCAGRRQSLAFSPSMRADTSTRASLENDLRSVLALERTQLRTAVSIDQFVMHFQPQVSATDGRLIGFEALLRWNHPQRGLLGPGAFIPLAEEIGVIGLLGQWALRTACEAALRWKVPAHGCPLTVAVNVSPLQLLEGPALITGIAAVLAETRLDPARLHIEIVESALLGDVAAILRDIKALGVHLSMDDFGSGYASLGNLARFPFDQLKMDRSFILAIETTKAGARMIRVIAALGKILGLATVAEGVETLAQAALVRTAGVTAIQGYFCGRPIPEAAVPALIDQFDSRFCESA